jgi:ABC-type nickel/cobalt efflux system permease component RcnA
MQSSDIPPLWSVSKANAAWMASSFAVLWLVLAINRAAPAWSGIAFVLALLFGGWWCYRWHGDLKLAHSNRPVHTTPQTHVPPARTTPSTKPSLYVPDVKETLYLPDARS